MALFTYDDADILVNFISQRKKDSIMPYLSKIGSFRQYCIQARKFLFSHPSPEYHLIDLIVLTYHVIRSISRNDMLFWEECKLIIGPEFDAFVEERVTRKVNDIVSRE